MSVKLMSMVFDHFDGDPSAVLLALALSDFASDDGRNIFPSIATLSKKTRCSEATVHRYIRQFTKNGWLEIEELGGGRKTNVYRISQAWMDNCVAKEYAAVKARQEESRGVTMTLQGCHHDTPGVSPRDPIHHITVIDPKNEESAPAVRASFETESKSPDETESKSLEPQPKAQTKAKAVPKPEERLRPDDFHASLPRDKWDEWIAYRRARRQPITLIGLRRQLSFLSRYTTDQQCDVIDTSLRNEWIGLFPPRNAPQQRLSKYDQGIQELIAMHEREDREAKANANG